MKSLLRFALLGLLLAAPALAQTAPALDGDWDGAVHLSPQASLRMSLHIETIGTVQSVRMISVDQGDAVIPVAGVTLKGNQVTFDVPLINSSYQATLSADGKMLTGIWKQGPASLPLVMSRRVAGQAAPAAYKRPQEPQKPYPYREIEVSYPGTDGISLSGTLTVPSGSGNFPAVLLIGGSGPNNRNEDILGHRPFLLLADYLTRRGIAVLRVDKRGIGKSTGDYANATSMDFAEDVKSGLAFLKTRAEVDGKKIGLIGHSEGGVIAPMVAADDPSVAFIVLMAGAGVRGDVLMPRQLRLIGKAAGISDRVMDGNVALSEELYSAVERARDTDDAVAQQRAVLSSRGALIMPAQLSTTASPWFRFFLSYDPAPALQKVKCPVLALNGDKDLQVDAAQNLPAIKAALSANPDAQTILLPGLNHLFQTAKTGSPAEYQQIEETISPSALATIGDWIAKHTR